MRFTFRMKYASRNVKFVVMVNAFQGGNNVGNAPVRVSFLSIRASTSASRHAVDNVLVNGDIPPLHTSTISSDREANRYEVDSPTYSDSDLCTSCDRICFNVGRELYVFVYRSVH